MSFQVLNILKLKSNQDIQEVANHNLRQAPSRNVDGKKTPLNKYYVGSPQMDTLHEVEQRLATCPKYRKDAVRVVDLVLSASPEFFTDKKKGKDWETITQKWLEDTFGKDNIIYSVVHYDEKTPHFHVCLTPIHEGKLRASHWFDGPMKLKKIHDSYAKVTKPLGLQRGRPHVKSSQVELDSYYQKVNASTVYERKLDEKLDTLFDRLDNPTIGQRLNPWGMIDQVVKPLMQQLTKNLSHHRTKSKDYDTMKKDRDYWKGQFIEEREKVLNYAKKLKMAGIAPDSTPDELALYKPVIQAIRGKATTQTPDFVEVGTVQEPFPKGEVLIEDMVTPTTSKRPKI